jgi:Holliday junction resolvasome RuvABC endonuclease subunit
MPGHYIIGIDPGRVTAWAAGELTGTSALRLKGYGIIAQTEAGDAALIKATEAWLDSRLAKLGKEGWSIAFEKAILSHSVHADETTSKVRGCIEAWAIRHGIPYGEYAPSTVKATVCAHRPTDEKRTKKDVAYAVKDLLGCDWIKATYDDLTDAMAVMATHAVKSHKWYPCGLNRPSKGKLPPAFFDRLHEKINHLGR